MINIKSKLIEVYFYMVSIFQFFIYLLNKNNELIEKQKLDVYNIPIIIINFNQLFYLKKLLFFLTSRGYRNIIIIDNNSTYEPLLDYYKTLDDSFITVEYQEKNYGHLVFFRNRNLIKKYSKQGYYILTDSDVVPNEKLTSDFALELIKIMEKYHFNICKVGFALKIDDIPNKYPLKTKVLKWEKQFWEKKVKDTENLYYADIDTTFALYKPFYRRSKFQNFFTRGIRIGGNYTSKHGGWYIEPESMTDEQKFYFKTSNSSSSWVFDSMGEIIKKDSNKQYE